MPNARDNAKGTGDVHPPEVEDMAPQADDTQDASSDGSLGRDLQDERRAGKGINQAGYLKDKDAPGTGGSERS